MLTGLIIGFIIGVLATVLTLGFSIEPVEKDKRSKSVHQNFHKQNAYCHVCSRVTKNTFEGLQYVENDKVVSSTIDDVECGVCGYYRSYENHKEEDILN